MTICHVTTQDYNEFLIQCYSLKWLFRYKLYEGGVKRMYRYTALILSNILIVIKYN